MIDTIRRRGVRSPAVLKALDAIPRHFFVPADYSEEAYADYPIPIGPEQTISQPYIVAYMLEALDLQPQHRVLDIGTGSGWQTGLLATMVDAVVSIDISPAMTAFARKNLESFQFKNVELVTGDGREGFPLRAPYDRIIAAAASPDIPRAVLGQLSAENGKFIMPVGEFRQSLVLFSKDGPTIQSKELVAVSFVPLR